MAIKGTIDGITPPKRVLQFQNVGELIDYLSILGRDRYIMIDNDGSTYPLTSDDIMLWDENLENSPIAFFVPRN